MRTTSHLPSINTALLYLFLLGASLLSAFLISQLGTTIGVLLSVAFVGIAIILKIFTDVEFGFYVLVWYSYFLFLIDRLFPAAPVNVGTIILQLTLFVSVLSLDYKRKKIDWSYFQNPITYIFGVFVLYNFLQAFNPNATSLTAWLKYIQSMTYYVITYFVIIKIFTSLNVIKKFTQLWLFLSLLGALYAFYQEIFGYMDFEWRYIHSNNIIQLIQNWGILRKFSFLAGVADFGMLMAISGIGCLVLATGPYRWSIRIILIISAVLMFIAMSFSGTRTATVMVPIGLIMYIILYCNKKSTLIIVIFCVTASVVVLYGPFYGGLFTRIRSAFEPSKDASMNVREVNRRQIQPYIHSHPMGGGVYTTDVEGQRVSPGHPLSGFASDNGYLKTALNIGWIGLVIQMALFFMVMAIGVVHFYQSKDPEIKTLYATYICIFFALLIANYAQKSMREEPINLIALCIYTIMPNMIRFDTSRREQ